MKQRAGLRFERTLWGDEVSLIAGVDEVGRGPLAGPVTAGAAVFPRNVRASGRFRFLKYVNDSKQVPAEQREELAALIWEHALAAAVFFVSVETIDRIGIAEASRQAMLGAIGDLGVRPEHLLLDAFRIPGCGLPQTPIIRGDSTSISIAAASIIAKVARDRVMDDHDGSHPGYGFVTNKGYYTPEHVRAIRDLGPCDLHRRSFSPVKEILLGEQLPFWFDEDAPSAHPEVPKDAVLEVSAG
jgi:ribonuclease HII